jgi:hypothetical protein
VGKWRHLPTGMMHTMADTPSQTTAAAADTNSGGAPAGNGSSASTTTQQQERELTLAEALELDLAEPADDKKGNGGANSTSDEGDGSDEGDDANHGDDGSDDGDDQGDDGNDSDEGDDEDSNDDDDGSDDDSEGDTSKDKKKDDDKDDDEAPKGLESLPKWAQKRIQKQSESIRSFKEQIAKGGITLTPTPIAPLAHVRDQESLTKEIQTAKQVRSILGKLKDEDYQDGPNGLQAEVQVGQQKYVFSKDEVAAKLAYAETVLDPEVITSRQDYLRHRETHKPWEVAEQVMPGILEKDSGPNQAYMHLLKLCPELAARVPDYEFIIACAVRGLSQYKDESEGKAKWQRFALDAKGNIVPPKRKAEKGSKHTTPANKNTPTPPTAQRPALRPDGGKATSADLDELQKRAESGDEEARRELMRLEMAA